MVLIGTSGYNYGHWWDGVFYPANLPQRKWLEFYAEHFDTVELNVSFYRLPKKETFEGWYERTPNRFWFAVKGSRYITHIKRLKDCKEPLSLLLDHASLLREKLGVILWQLPPRFKFREERLEEFCILLSNLPDSKLLRHSFEFRDESWFCDEAFQILEKYHFAFCIAHGIGLRLMERVTSESIYLRFHGGEVLYGSNYSHKELKGWAKKIRDWRAKGKDIFVYFNNDAYGFAIQNALTLKKLVYE
ncbi:MAG: DUF72 domain-containing protein [Deltaproteobacteria bacterium]|nr:DUF72 domain-containing protein [Deltaproteobacteria bacterium]